MGPFVGNISACADLESQGWNLCSCQHGFAIKSLAGLHVCSYKGIHLVQKHRRTIGDLGKGVRWETLFLDYILVGIALSMAAMC